MNRSGTLFRSRLAALVMLLMLLNGCQSVKVSDYAEFQPAMDMESFFDGSLTAHGVVKDWRGRVIRYFNADIVAYWQDGIGTLEEDFLFNDGEQQRRVWTLKPNGDGGYDGTAGDVVGSGAVSVAGNSVFLDYVLRIPYGDRTIDVAVDDRMYLVAPDVLINESALRKFGIEVGKILLVIQRQ